MNAELVAEKICRDVWQRVGKRDDRSWIVTRFRYPDGDFVNIYFESFAGGIQASDYGHTLRKLHLSGITLTEPRRNLIAVVCHLHGVTFDGTVFYKSLASDSVGVDCISLCQAIAKISNLDYESPSHAISSFSSQVDFIVERLIKPHCSVSVNWNDPEVDPTGRFPVDYKFNGVDPARYLFKVTTEEKRSRVGETCGFLKMKNRLPASVAVVDIDAGIKDSQIELLENFTKVIMGVSGNEDHIVRFALEGVLA